MRTTTDAIRSLKRYVAEMFPDWEVRLAEAQEAFARPFALVGPSGPELWTGPAHTTDTVLPATVHLYPSKGATPEAALIGVLDASEGVYEGFRVGVGYGGPMRIPLWDYTGVTEEQTATSRVEFPGEYGRDDHLHGDYMRINDLSVNRIRDPADPTLWTIAVDLRLGWRRKARLPSEGELLREVRLTPEGSS